MQRANSTGRTAVLVIGTGLALLLLLSPPHPATNGSSECTVNFDYVKEMRSLRTQVAQLQASQEELTSLRDELSQAKQVSATTVANLTSQSADHYREVAELKELVARLEKERAAAADLIDELQLRMASPSAPISEAAPVLNSSPAPIQPVPTTIVYRQPVAMLSNNGWQYTTTYSSGGCASGACNSGSCSNGGRRFGWRR